MIHKFSCNNFRNVKAENLEFEKINILIGPNNSGKSNFIKALTFMGDMLGDWDKGNLKSAFLNAVSRNGWEHVLNKKAVSKDTIDLCWIMDLDGKQVEYKFSFTVGKAVEDCNIALEEWNPVGSDMQYGHYNYFHCHGRMPGQGFFRKILSLGISEEMPFALSNKEMLYFQVKDIMGKDSRWFLEQGTASDVLDLVDRLRNCFSIYSIYTSAKFDFEAIRKPAEIKGIYKRLKDDVSNFTNIFNQYKSKNILWKNEFEKKLQELIPDLQAADTVAMYDNLIFRLAYGGEQYDLSDVSEGTLKCLILNMLINMPMESGDSLLALDEPETNLHPAWQKIVGNWLQTSGAFEQCFVSTHSPDFLDTFTETFKTGKTAVFVFDSNGTIKKIKYTDIADELGEWELGDLYRTNDPALGGWPW